MLTPEEKVGGIIVRHEIKNLVVRSYNRDNKLYVVRQWKCPSGILSPYWSTFTNFLY